MEGTASSKPRVGATERSATRLRVAFARGRWLAGVAAVLISALLAPARPTQAAPQPVLFRDVNVVPMTDESLLQARDVLVTNGKIQSIAPAGTVQAPADALIVNGSGRYLMPGLAEMHAHLPPRAREQEALDILLLYVAHGVTTIRGMLGDPWHPQLRQQLERQEVFGPRLFTAGPSFNGNSAPDIQTAQRMVREQAAAGYDFLKLHPGLKRDVFDAIAASALDAKITFQGHVSIDVGVPHALQAKQRAIDHLDGYVMALADPGCAQKVRTSFIFGMELAHCADLSRIPALVRSTKEAGTWMVPTQILLEQWAVPPAREALLARPGLRYLPPGTVDRWLSQLHNFIGPNAVPAEQGKRYIEVTRALIRELHKQGVPIAAGSDSPQVFNIPGDSVLREIALYVDIGLSPHEALRTATVNPARFFNAESRFGTVREGLEADLILVEDNPLSDIRALRQLAGVMVRGQWLPRATLDEKLNALAERVNP